MQFHLFSFKLFYLLKTFYVSKFLSSNNVFWKLNFNTYSTFLKLHFLTFTKNYSYTIFTTFFNYMYYYNLKTKFFPKHSLYNFFRGFFKHYKGKIKLIGLRYRILSVKRETNEFWLNIGLSHFFGIQLGENYLRPQRHKKRKHALKFFALNRFALTQILFLIRRFRGPNVFTGNGIRLLGEKPLLKPRRRLK